MRSPARPYIVATVLAASVLITAVLHSPLYIVPGAVATGILAGPRVYDFLKKDAERRGIDRETPYFVVYAASLHSSGIPLYKSLLMTRSSSLFRHISKQAEVLEQLLRVVHDPVDALYQLSQQSPSKEFAQILRNYASLLRSGGQPHVYLKNLAQHYSRRLEDSWSRFSTLLVEAEEAYLMIYVLGSFLLLLYSLLSSATAPLLLFSFFMAPLLGAALLAYIHYEEPGLRLPSRFKLLHLAPYPGSLAVFVASEPRLGVWLALVISATPLLVHGIYLELTSRRRAARLRSEISAAFNEISDYVRLGYPLDRAIEMVLRDPSLSSEAGRVLSAVTVSPESAYLSSGDLDDNYRYLLVLLAHMGSTYTPPEIFDLVNGFLATTSYATRRAKSRVKPYEAVMLVYPPVLLYVAKKISGMLASISVPAAGFLSTLAPGTVAALGGSMAALVVVPLLVNTFIMDRIEGDAANPMKKGLALAVSGLFGALLSP